MVYDSDRHVIVMFGGYQPGYNTYLNDTWEYDGNCWRNVTDPANSPAPRSEVGMVYDSARHELVLFGGQIDLQNTPVDDTWRGTWNPETGKYVWTEVQPQPNSHPSVRSTPKMAYDEVRKVAVLYGGWVWPDCNSMSDETWEWDGVTWTRRILSIKPPPLRDQYMAYDSDRGVIVLFGGTSLGCENTNQTWEYGHQPIVHTGGPFELPGPDVSDQEVRVVPPPVVTPPAVKPRPLSIKH